ncbi:regulator of chromosome condensation 1/beta-lactamase-inhibitor protein II [Armillaria fumosa]|nr:regulator of chromosome condensation 1/beta-lactamase-inhibitor protein II [Armillaria fumosa]
MDGGQRLGGGDGKSAHAACGMNHTLLVSSDGTVWTTGTNMLGQTIPSLLSSATPIACCSSLIVLQYGCLYCLQMLSFKRIPFFVIEEGQEKAITVSGGVMFSCVLTESGKVYAFGSAEKGELGNGMTGVCITTHNKMAFNIIYESVLVKDLGHEKTTQRSSGQQHSIALDEIGTVYVWGYNGHCRLGLGNHVDALRPKQVLQFTGANAGMTSKWKNSLDGSSGSPYSSFRYMTGIMGCKITTAASGGVTHWALTSDEDGDGVTTIYGSRAPQGVRSFSFFVNLATNVSIGELGLGPAEPKSATKTTKHARLGGLDLLSVAPGQNTRLFLFHHHLSLFHVEPDVLHSIRTAIDIVLDALRYLDVSSPTSVALATSQTNTTTSSPPITTTSAESSTTSLTTIVTSISGHLTTYTTNMPTSLASSDPGSSTNVNRTALIAGVTTAAVVLVALALGAVFIYKRPQKWRIGFMEAIKCIRDRPNTPVSIPRSMQPPSPPPSESSNYSTASLVRGDSGSMFREEVWLPPHDGSGHSREPTVEEDP